jgi:hypothetical protein
MAIKLIKLIKRKEEDNEKLQKRVDFHDFRYIT